MCAIDFIQLQQTVLLNRIHVYLLTTVHCVVPLTEIHFYSNSSLFHFTLDFVWQRFWNWSFLATLWISIDFSI